MTATGTPRQIVCGEEYKWATRCPLALPGAVLGPDFKIKVASCAAVESNGML